MSKTPSKGDYKKAFDRLQKKYIEAVNRMNAAERAWQLSQMQPPFDRFMKCTVTEVNEHAARVMDALNHDPSEVTTWKNSRYTVEVRDLEPEDPDNPVRCVYLSIKRNDKDAIGKERFRDFQRIKNELVDVEAEGIEIYPAESRLVDASNQYHMYCLVGAAFPFGFGDRLIVKGHNADKPRPHESRQLPFDNPPDDALTIEELQELEEKTIIAAAENKQ